MQWSELYGAGHEPTEKQLEEYISTPLWKDLSDYLRQTYKTEPKLSYSLCGMDDGFWKGWNVKYKKGGKALCTIYPKQKYFVASIAIGAKEAAAADLLIPLCDDYTQDLYRNTEGGSTWKSLALHVTSESILNDVKNFVALRVNPPKAS